MLAFLLAVGGAESTMAQQGWSPQPFVPDPQTRPLSSAQATPSNRLRGDSTAADDKPVVLRWRGQTKAQQLTTVSNQAVFAESPVAQSIQHPVTPAANWTERTSPQSNRIVRAVVEPEAFQDRWNDRNDSSTSVVPAQFDVPPTAKPGAEASNDLFDSNLLPPKEALPLKDSLPPSNGMRSLIEPSAPDSPPKVLNPFPPESSRDELDLFPSDNPSAKDRIPSPSDLDLPPPNLRRSKEDDTAEAKPKSTKRSDVKCDDVRERAFSADIDKIQLDVAPSFGVGPKDKLSSEEKRDTFAKSAPHRTWFDQSGAQIADGRLVDFAHNQIIIETQGGSRSSIPLRKLSEPDATYVFEAWGLPMTCSLGSERIAARIYEPTTVAWKASGLCHKPLYFEDIQLERSGHEYGPIIQPAISSVHFFKNIAFLPYKMGINPMTECQYALGHYRPGNCAPWSIEPIPLSLRGAAAQAKVITGAVLVLP